MGTRDKVLGDAHLVRPIEQKSESPMTEEGEISSKTVADQQTLDEGDTKENLDVTTDGLIDINKYKFNDKFNNYLYSTCPLVPKFHASFGQPIEKQDISMDIDLGKNSDAEKQEAKKLLGRVDTLYKHEETGLNLVKDDFGIHILYEATFADMRVIETEILKICSFYINKAEPLLDNDLRNMYPAVDRLKILDEVLKYENMY